MAMGGFNRASRRAIHSLQSLLPEKTGGVFILAYHLVDGGTDFPVDLSGPVFRRHMEYIATNARPCALAEAVNILERKQISQVTNVVITFDDAYGNFYTHVWPVMREMRIPCTLYVPVDFIEGKSPAPLQGLRSLAPCSWGQLREIAESGLVGIGSHTFSHPNLQRVSAEYLLREIVNSRKELESRLGMEVTSFAYPRALWSAKADRYVRESYDNAVVAGGKKLYPGNWDRYRLSRMPVRRDMEDIAPLLHASVWLEEKIASLVRPWKHRIKEAGDSW